MTDMHVSDLAPIGAIHGIASLIALLAGAWNLVMPKGTRSHQVVGLAYMLAMVVVNITVFAIYRFDIASFQPFKAGPNTFGLFHWFAVWTLGFLAIGWYAGGRQDRMVWAYLHPIMMVLSYYMLLAGGINELFVRVDIFRELAIASAGGSQQFGQSPLIGMVHTGWMAFILLMLIWFSVRVFIWRWQAKRAARLAIA
jgi:uncharacterized membrane protein